MKTRSSVDLFMSHRDCFEQCKWWKRDEDDQYLNDELVMKREPSGIFWAKEITPERAKSMTVGGNFMFSQNTVVIRSPDNLGDLDRNDLVLYQGEKWIVIDVQKKHYKQKSAEFATDKNVSHFWYINMRR